VDAEFVSLLDDFRKERPDVKIIIDTDTDAIDATNGGEFDRAVLEGYEFDQQNGSKGWVGLQTQVEDEDDMISLAYTSGTTAKPKGVVYTHRGAYLASLANVIESGLNIEVGGQRAKYLWTLPMFHVRALDRFRLLERMLMRRRQMDGHSLGV
jgi:long-subunit acyl-CoA synthetase (AMP-forming)